MLLLTTSVIINLFLLLLASFSDMAALRHSPQRELFLTGEERLVGLVHVTSIGKKKKSAFIAVTNDQIIGANLYKV